MKLVGILSAATLSLVLGITVPAYAQQEQHDQPEDKRAEPAKPAQQEEKSKEVKPAHQAEKRSPDAKPAQDEKRGQEAKPAEEKEPHAKPVQHAGGGRIPDDRFRANFGREHTFRVSRGDYGNRRFQYGGYWFGFVDVWPSNWLYTQDVFVVEINGVYYLCNASYPGVNLTLSVTI